MLKVLIVDDEPIVRHGIVQGVEWKAMGCDVVGEASNGEEGLELYSRYQPDIIIADEPTGNIDPHLAEDIMDLFVWINQNLHKTVVVVTHAENLVNKYNHRVIRLEGGKVASDRVGGMFDEQ